MRPTEPGVPGLADRLNELFRTVRRPATNELWNNETAAYEISRSGPSVSAAYLSQLRTGKRLNPSARHLAALAAMFGMPMEFFFPSSDAVGRLPGTGPTPAPARVVRLLEGVSRAGLDDIEAAIVRIRAAEGLPPVGEPSPDGAASASRTDG